MSFKGNSQHQLSNISAFIDIQLKNHNGANLLGSGRYPIENIVAKYSSGNLNLKNNNTAILLDSPNNVLFVDENKTAPYIRVFLNHEKAEEFPLTYIHWNKTEIDTIKTQYRRNEHSIVLNKAWIFKNNSWEEIKSKPLVIIK
jgi:hypothetical protein